MEPANHRQGLNLAGRTDRVQQLGHVSLADGASNTMIGLNAGKHLVSRGRNNTLVGAESGTVLTGSDNTVLGAYACETSTSVSDNVVVGWGSGRQMSNVEYCVLVGTTAGTVMQKSSYNTAVGYGAAGRMVSGARNTFVGSLSAYYIRNASDNVFVGDSAGKNTRYGEQNVFLGAEAGALAISTSNSVFVGYRAGFAAAGSDNTVVGKDAGVGQGSDNTVLGSRAAANADVARSVLLGSGVAARAKGNNNVVVGGFLLANASVLNDTVAVGIGTANLRADGLVMVGTRCIPDAIVSNGVVLGHTVRSVAPATRLSNLVALGLNFALEEADSDSFTVGFNDKRYLHATENSFSLGGKTLAGSYFFANAAQISYPGNIEASGINVATVKAGTLITDNTVISNPGDVVIEGNLTVNTAGTGGYSLIIDNSFVFDAKRVYEGGPVQFDMTGALRVDGDDGISVQTTADQPYSYGHAFKVDDELDFNGRFAIFRPRGSSYPSEYDENAHPYVCLGYDDTRDTYVNMATPVGSVRMMSDKIQMSMNGGAGIVITDDEVVFTGKTTFGDGGGGSGMFTADTDWMVNGNLTAKAVSSGRHALEIGSRRVANVNVKGLELLGDFLTQGNLTARCSAGGAHRLLVANQERANLHGSGIAFRGDRLESFTAGGYHLLTALSNQQEQHNFNTHATLYVSSLVASLTKAPLGIHIFSNPSPNMQIGHFQLSTGVQTIYQFYGPRIEITSDAVVITALQLPSDTTIGGNLTVIGNVKTSSAVLQFNNDTTMNGNLAATAGPSGSHVFVVDDKQVANVHAGGLSVDGTLQVAGNLVAAAAGPQGSHVFVVDGKQVANVHAGGLGVDGTLRVAGDLVATAAGPQGSHVFAVDDKQVANVHARGLDVNGDLLVQGNLTADCAVSGSHVLAVDGKRVANVHAGGVGVDGTLQVTGDLVATAAGPSGSHAFRVGSQDVAVVNAGGVQVQGNLTAAATSTGLVDLQHSAGAKLLLGSGAAELLWGSVPFQKGIRVTNAGVEILGETAAAELGDKVIEGNLTARAAQTGRHAFEIGDRRIANVSARGLEVLDGLQVQGNLVASTAGLVDLQHSAGARLQLGSGAAELLWGSVPFQKGIRVTNAGVEILGETAAAEVGDKVIDGNLTARAAQTGRHAFEIGDRRIANVSAQGLEVLDGLQVRGNLAAAATSTGLVDLQHTAGAKLQLGSGAAELLWGSAPQQRGIRVTASGVQILGESASGSSLSGDLLVQGNLKAQCHTTGTHVFNVGSRNILTVRGAGIAANTASSAGTHAFWIGDRSALEVRPTGLVANAAHGAVADALHEFEVAGEPRFSVRNTGITADAGGGDNRHALNISDKTRLFVDANGLVANTGSSSATARHSLLYNNAERLRVDVGGVSLAAAATGRWVANVRPDGLQVFGNLSATGGSNVLLRTSQARLSMGASNVELVWGSPATAGIVVTPTGLEFIGETKNSGILGDTLVRGNLTANCHSSGSHTLMINNSEIVKVHNRTYAETENTSYVMPACRVNERLDAKELYVPSGPYAPPALLVNDQLFRVKAVEVEVILSSGSGTPSPVGTRFLKLADQNQEDVQLVSPYCALKFSNPDYDNQTSDPVVSLTTRPPFDTPVTGLYIDPATARLAIADADRLFVRDTGITADASLVTTGAHAFRLQDRDALQITQFGIVANATTGSATASSAIHDFKIRGVSRFSVTNATLLANVSQRHVFDINNQTRLFVDGNGLVANTGTTAATARHSLLYNGVERFRVASAVTALAAPSGRWVANVTNQGLTVVGDAVMTGNAQVAGNTVLLQTTAGASPGRLAMGSSSMELVYGSPATAGIVVTPTTVQLIGAKSLGPLGDTLIVGNLTANCHSSGSHKLMVNNSERLTVDNDGTFADAASVTTGSHAFRLQNREALQITQFGIVANATTDSATASSAIHEFKIRGAPRISVTNSEFVANVTSRHAFRNVVNGTPFDRFVVTNNGLVANTGADASAAHVFKINNVDRLTVNDDGTLADAASATTGSHTFRLQNRDALQITQNGIVANATTTTTSSAIHDFQIGKISRLSISNANVLANVDSLHQVRITNTIKARIARQFIDFSADDDIEDYENRKYRIIIHRSQGYYQYVSEVSGSQYVGMSFRTSSQWNNFRDEFNNPELFNEQDAGNCIQLLTPVNAVYINDINVIMGRHNCQQRLSGGTPILNGYRTKPSFSDFLQISQSSINFTFDTRQRLDITEARLRLSANNPQTYMQINDTSVEIWISGSRKAVWNASSPTV
jgi:hypothetical protein